MFSIISTSPYQNENGIFIDSKIILSFNTQPIIENISTSSVELYHTSSTDETLYELIGTTLSVVDNTLEIIPIINLGKNLEYTLIISNNNTSIHNSNSEYLDEPFVLYFKTTDTTNPLIDVSVNINDINNFTDANLNDDPSPSTDLFSTNNDVLSPELIEIFPSNSSVGITQISYISFRFNDNIANTINRNSITLTYRDLPFDIDPFANNVIEIGDIEIDGNIVRFNIIDMPDTQNREFNIRVAPNTFYGVEKKQSISTEITSRFIGRLTPMYTSPKYIINQLTSFDSSMKLNIDEYELYLKILEHSILLNIDASSLQQQDLIKLSKYITCLIMKDLILFGNLLKKDIKSRTLLYTKVEYHTTDNGNITKAIDDCLSENALDITGDRLITTGIKSGNTLNHNTKIYGVYR